MTQCSGCSLTFPCLVLAECGKCVKRNGAASATDNAVIDVHTFFNYHRPYQYKFYSILKKQPQCMECGVIYPYLRGLLCGVCLNCSETGMSLYLQVGVIHSPQIYEDPSIFDGTSFIFLTCNVLTSFR